MRMGCKDLATSLGYSDEQGIIIENGGVIEVKNNVAMPTDEKVQTNYILIDGLGIGDIGAQVIMDRQTLAENGILIILIPIDKKSRMLKDDIEIISRGFIYMKESEALIKQITEHSQKLYKNIMEKRPDAKRNEVKQYIRQSLDKLVHEKIERQPLILPILLEK